VENNDGISGLTLEANFDGQSGLNTTDADNGDYIDWNISVPATGFYSLTARAGTVSPATAQILIDNTTVAELGLPNTQGWHTWRSFSTQSFPLTAGAHKLRILFTSRYQNLNWVKLNASEENPKEDLTVGLWRIASRTDRLTLTYNTNTALPVGAKFSGSARQAWRAKKISGDNYEFQLEHTNQCLTVLSSQIALSSCGGNSGYWTLEQLRLRTEDRPAIYRLRTSQNTCLQSNNDSIPTIGDCNNDTARWYIEPIGYDERTKKSPLYEVRALLIVKATTNVAGLTQGSIAPDIITAARTSFEKDLALWFNRMTDGLVVWKAESVVSPDPLTSLIGDGGPIWLPRAESVPEDVNRYLVRGKYDLAVLFFTGGTVSGGWGWSRGSTKESNYALWATVNGGTTPAADWLSGNAEPISVFIHEPMHGYEDIYAPLNLPLPDGGLHGTEINKYTDDSVNSWMAWYRDYWLGTIIAQDDTYRGFGPRMFRMPTPRDISLTYP